MCVCARLSSKGARLSFIVKEIDVNNDVSVLVATGFPAGQTPLHTRLDEIKYAVSQGASEIDIVINRHFALIGNWKGMV